MGEGHLEAGGRGPVGRVLDGDLDGELIDEQTRTRAARVCSSSGEDIGASEVEVAGGLVACTERVEGTLRVGGGRGVVLNDEPFGHHRTEEVTRGVRCRSVARVALDEGVEEVRAVGLVVVPDAEEELLDGEAVVVDEVHVVPYVKHAS